MVIFSHLISRRQEFSSDLVKSVSTQSVKSVGGNLSKVRDVFERNFAGIYNSLNPTLCYAIPS